MLLIAFGATHAFAQTITVGPIDPGPYSQGSTITAPISVDDSGGCIAQGNTYNLYLSDASGNFSPGTLIGSYNGFYAPFVNGVIPAGTPAGTGYKLEVQSTSPAVTSSVSAAFTINAGAAVTASASSSATLAPGVFGSCINFPGETYTIAGTSATGTTETASFYNEATGAYEGTNIAIPNTGYVFAPTASNYAVIVKATDASGNVGTYSYELINNIIRNNFGSTGNGFVCLVGGRGDLSFNIAVTGPSGISSNYPGDVYVVNWGDGTSTTYTYCQLKALGGVVTHTFTLPSCGQTQNNVVNSFFVQNQAINPLCGAITSAPGVSAKVLIQPITSFAAPAISCAGTALVIPNTSQPGPDPNNVTTATCATNPNALYDWSLDGVPQAGYQGVPLSTSFVFPTSLTSGTHTLTLHAELPTGGGIGCVSPDYTQTICFEKAPQPSFTIPAEVCVTAGPVTPNNTSIAYNVCSAATYEWTVTGPGAVSYAGGTTANDAQPQFVFPTAGTYTVQLGMRSGCGLITTTQTINVDAAPTAVLSPDVLLCGNNQTLTFDPTQTVTKTTFSGTTQQQPTTYTWTVTGGAYSFVGGTNANSEFPQILFNDIATYTVQVVHQNTCGSVSVTQKITFEQAPVPHAGPDQTVCASSPAATLAGSVTGFYTIYKWTGGGGTFNPSRNVLNPVYTPSASEIAAGQVTLTLQVNSTVPAPCNVATDNVTIHITPTPIVNSPPTAGVCSQQALNYTITADQPLTTFTWTASATTGSPTGFTASGSGNSITDVLTNTGTADAVVTYLITPTLLTCPGSVFTLTVTVHPLPVITAAPVNSPICNNKPANIALGSNVANTSYTWTSTATAGITGNTNQATPQLITSIQDILVNGGALPGTVTYTVTPYNGTCAGPPVITTITVEPSPITANAGPNDEVCNQTSYVLQGNNPSPGTGKWTLVSGPGTIVFSNTANPNATVSGLIPGNVYQFRWTTTYDPACPTSSKVVKITDDTPPVGGTTSSPATVCSGSNAGQVTLAGQSGTILRWESSVNGGTSWQPIANTSIILNYSNLTQTTEYRAVMHNGVCTDAPSTATTITVVAPPVASNPGPNDEVCNVTAYTLQGNNPAPATGLWTVVSGPGTPTFVDPTDPHSVVNGLQPGNTYQFQWTITGSSSCPPNSNTVTIIIDKAPVGGTTGAPAEVCSGSNAGQITLSGQFGTIIRWESSTDGGASWTPITTNTGTTQSYLNLTQTTAYRAVLHNGNICADAPSTATTITVDPLPVASNAGPNAEVCSLTSYTLQGNNPSPGTGKWTLVSGPGSPTFVDDTDPNTVVNGLQPGSIYQFKWTITGAPTCPPSVSTVNIIIDKAPVGGTTSSPAEVCSGDNSGQIVLAGQFGTIVRWESTTDGGTNWTPIANTNTTQTYFNLTQTTGYRAIVHNGNACTDVPSTTTTITVDPLAVTSNAGPNDEVCNFTSYNLHGNNPSPGTGLWTVVSGPVGATFSDATNPNAVVSGLIPGSVYKFQWAITGSASCPPSLSTVKITIDQAPVGGTTSAPAEVCSGSNAGQITLAGFVGSVVRWESSVNNGTSWQVIANTTTTQSYLNLTQTTQYRAIVNNGVCTDVPSTATTITVDQPPVASNPGPNDEICNSTTYTLQGNSPAPGTGKWTVVSGPGTPAFSDDTKPNAVVSGLIPGNVYQFQWTITGTASCPPNSKTVTITDDLPPVGGTTSAPAEVCAGGNAGQITLAGQFGTVVRWESSVDGGASWQPITNTATTQAYTNLTQTTQYRAIIHNGVCTDVPSSATKITVDPPPVTSNPGPNDEVCGVTSYTLQGNNPSPGTGKWTVVSGPGTPVFSNDTDPHAIVSGLIAGNVYKFQWTITGLAGCPPSSNTVTITIDQPPVGGTTSSDATVCINGNGGQITLAGQFGNIVRWESSVDNGVTWLQIANTNTTLPYLNLTQTTQYRAIVHHSNTCPDVASTVTTITVAPLPIAASAGSNDEVCGVTTYTLNGNNPAPGTGKWTVVAGPAGATFSDDTKPNATVSGLIPGSTYQFEWTISTSASCPSNSSTVTIIIDKPPVGGTATANPAEVCFGSNGGKVTLSGQFGTIFGWQMSTDNGTTWQAIGNSTSTQTFTNLAQTTEYRAILHNSNICADVYSTPAIVVVDPMPVVSNPGPDAEVCSVTAYTLHGNNPAPGTGKWTVTQGPAGATFSDDTKPNATVSGLIPGNVYQFKWTITSSPTSTCPPSSNTVNITIDQSPVGGTTSSPAEVCSGSNGGQITLAGQFGTVLRWESSVNGGASWQPINNTSTAQSYLNLTQTTSYRAVVHNGATCPNVFSTVTTITVDPPPVTANAGPGAELCNITTYTLQGNNPAPWTGQWTVISGPTGATFSDDTKPNAIVSGLIPGSVYQFQWTITNSASCGPSSSIVTIATDQPPVGGTTSGIAEVCAGSNSGKITLAGQFGAIVRWESSVNNGVTWQPIANTNPEQTYLNLTQTTQFRAVMHNSATCPDAFSTPTTITVDPPPPVADAGEDDEVCGLVAYTLSGNSPAPGTGKWIVISGPAGATFNDPTQPNAVVSGLIPGNVYQFSWTISSTASCPPSTDMVTITIDKAPIGGTTASDNEVCAGSNAGQIHLTGQFGTIVRWEFSTDNGTTWQPIGNTSTTQSYTNLTQTTKYRAILHNGTVCADVPSTVTTIKVDPLPVTSVPGPDAGICSATSYTFHANNPAPGTGLWTLVQGPAGVTFSDATSPTATVSGLIPGNIYQFKWEITGIGPCPPSSGVITITDQQSPVGGSTAGAATVCFGSGNGQITLSGQFGTIVRWESSIDNGNTWQPIANSTNTQIYSNLTRTTEYRAILHNGTVCTDAPSTPTTITVNPSTPIANAGPDFSVCNQTTITLNGNSPGTFGGNWIQTAGPPVNIVDPTNYTTQVTGLSGDNIYTFKWTIYGLPPCGDTYSSVNVTLHTDVIPSFIMNQNNGCGPTVVTFTNTSTPQPIGTFVWNFGDGSPSVTAVNPPPHSFNPSSDGTEITYYVSLTPTSNCGSQTPFIAPVTISPASPLAAIVPGQISSCGIFNLTVKNISPGDNIRYDFYLLDPGGAIVQHLTYPDKEDAVFSPVSPTQPTNYQLYMIATDKCGNQARTPSVTISGAPSSVTSQLQVKGTPSVCLGQQVTFQNISTGGDAFMITIYDATKKPIIQIPTGTNDLDYTPTTSGDFYASITAGFASCGNAPPSPLIPFVVYPVPQPAFSYTADENYNVTFVNTTPDAGGIPAPSLLYEWNFGDGSPTEASYIPTSHHFDFAKSPFTVTLKATTPGSDCFNIATQVIDVTFHGNIFVPNAIMPTSHQKELNTFFVKGYGLKKWHIQIFNNFGQLIWESTKLDSNGSPTEGWDGTYKGKIVEQGVYIWQVSGILLNGEPWKGMSYNGSAPSLVGPIHVIR